MFLLATLLLMKTLIPEEIQMQQEVGSRFCIQVIKFCIQVNK